MDCIREILIESGHHGMTMRTIADKCGISVGNVTYHFPNKNVLIEEFFSHLLEGFEESLNQFVARALPSREAVVDFFIWRIREAASDGNKQLMRELWTMASHYPKIADVMAKTMTAAIDIIANMLATVYPHARRHELEKFVATVALFVEGSPMLFGVASQQRVKMEEVLPTIERTIHYLLDDLQNHIRHR